MRKAKLSGLAGIGGAGKCLELSAPMVAGGEFDVPWPVELATRSSGRSVFRRLVGAAVR